MIKKIKLVSNVGSINTGRMMDDKDFIKYQDVEFDVFKDQCPFWDNNWDNILNIYKHNFKIIISELPEIYVVECDNAEQTNIVANTVTKIKNYNYSLGHFEYVEVNDKIFHTEGFSIYTTILDRWDIDNIISFDEWSNLMNLKNIKGKYAYKGFNSELKCRNEKFEIGITYSKPSNDKPKLCSSDGYHYCNTLSNINEHYPFANNNRYCIIEILGNYTEDESKGITTSFRIIRELDPTEIQSMKRNDEKSTDLLNHYINFWDSCKSDRDKNEASIKTKVKNQALIDKLVIEKLTERSESEKNKAKEQTQKIAKAMRLDLVRKFQKQYPHTQICGSVGLFLHGIELKRFTRDINDFDIITPYYTKFEHLPCGVLIDEISSEGRSGNDFKECITIEGIKADVRIDNTQKYDIIEFEGFKYKVSVLEVIWAAKLRYNNPKHNADLKEAMKIKK